VLGEAQTFLDNHHRITNNDQVPDAIGDVDFQALPERESFCLIVCGIIKSPCEL